MQNKYYATAREAIEKYVKDGDTIALAGVSNSCTAKELSLAAEAAFLETGHPANLKLITTSAPLEGLDMYAHDGMTESVIAGHYSNNEAMKEFIADNKCYSWNLPQGIINLLYRSEGAGDNGVLSKVGLGTFVDPRQEGARVNSSTPNNIIEVESFRDEEYLWYKPLHPTVAFIRGSAADEKGNVSLSNEMYWADAVSVAKAVKANGGKVIVQVRDYVKANSMEAHDIQIPGIYVDAVVTTKDTDKFHRMTPNTQFSEYLIGKKKMPEVLIQSAPKPLDQRKIIGRRAAMEVKKNTIVNIGFGMPEAASNVMTEEGLAEHITLAVEHGLIGGVAAPGERFAVHVNYDSMVDAPSQFDFFHTGGLDIALLGNAQTDGRGNVNVHKFGRLPTGIGGFIDIITTTKKIVFCGTFTAKGLNEHVENGKLVIDTEGSIKKYIKTLKEISFNADYALKNECKVIYITERAVFELNDGGLVLTEYAPGIDVEKDIIAQMDFMPAISSELKMMDERIFRDEVMGLTGAAEV